MRALRYLLLAALSIECANAQVVVSVVRINGAEITSDVGVLKSWVYTDGAMRFEYVPDSIFENGFE